MTGFGWLPGSTKRGGIIFYRQAFGASFCRHRSDAEGADIPHALLQHFIQRAALVYLAGSPQQVAAAIVSAIEKGRGQW
jgi:UDP-N-acetyl-D-mannosaminuronic acid transferase (WecB/TagA/CpsF family)